MVSSVLPTPMHVCIWPWAYVAASVTAQKLVELAWLLGVAGIKHDL